MLEGTSPAFSADYAAIMTQSTVDPSVPATVVSAVGEPCNGASDIVACEAALMQAIASEGGKPGIGQVPDEYFLVTTSGNEARRWWTRSDFLEFLGPIDTPQEALILTWYDGYAFDCDSGGAEATGSGFTTVGTKLTSDCTPVETTKFELHVSSAGELIETCSDVVSRQEGTCVGRRPRGLAEQKSDAATPALAGYFECVAHLESAAVYAFQHVADELASHGAPEALIQDARRAALDEVRHAALMSLVAERFGGRFREPRIEAVRARSLEDMAIENAIEGCVRETFGALTAAYQALACRDARIASTLREIAEDESRHAALSWQIAEWLDTRLSEPSKERVSIAAHRALEDLASELETEPDTSLTTYAGLPPARLARRMLASLGQLLERERPFAA